jgi:hypothetical protein
VEGVTKTLIFLGIPLILLLTLGITPIEDWGVFVKGVIGKGHDYRWWPAGMSVATFFAAFAYSGAGGNLNLTQSIYIKERGYGMGSYAQKISSLFTHHKTEQKIKLSGEQFEITPENINKFKLWWKRINTEHFLVFWFMGSIAMSLLMLLSYTTTYGLPSNHEGIKFVINQGNVIGQTIAPFIGFIFLLVITIMLFQTQFGILDSTSRIMAENYALKKIGGETSGSINLSKIYYTFLWLQIIFGILLFMLNIHEPKTLIVLGAVINAFAMFVHIALVNWLNYKSLPKEFQPGILRRSVIVLAFIIFGIFSFITIQDRLF